MRSKSVMTINDKMYRDALIEQINSATAKELAGYFPMVDRMDRNVFDLLMTIDYLANSMRKEVPEWTEPAMQISCLVSMIRTKLGFPASIHTAIHSDEMELQ